MICFNYVGKRIIFEKKRSHPSKNSKLHRKSSCNWKIRKWKKVADRGNWTGYLEASKHLFYLTYALYKEPTNLLCSTRSLHVMGSFRNKSSTENPTEKIITGIILRTKVLAREAVALQYFPPKCHRNDRLNRQGLILKKKRLFERKKLSMENLKNPSQGKQWNQEFFRLRVL